MKCAVTAFIVSVLRIFGYLQSSKWVIGFGFNVNFISDDQKNNVFKLAQSFLKVLNLLSNFIKIQIVGGGILLNSLKGGGGGFGRASLWLERESRKDQITFHDKFEFPKTKSDPASF